MSKVIFSQDVRPLSEFRANAAAFLQQVHDTKRPLVITQHGKSAAVLLGVHEYEALLEELELLREVQGAETQIDEGKGINHRNARKQVMERLGK